MQIACHGGSHSVLQKRLCFWPRCFGRCLVEREFNQDSGNAIQRENEVDELHNVGWFSIHCPLPMQEMIHRSRLVGVELSKCSQDWLKALERPKSVRQLIPMRPQRQDCVETLPLRRRFFLAGRFLRGDNLFADVMGDPSRKGIRVVLGAQLCHKLPTQVDEFLSRLEGVHLRKVRRSCVKRLYKRRHRRYLDIDNRDADVG